MAEPQAILKHKEHRNQKVQRKIYHCALDLFTKNGFENVKVSEICAAADVSVGTFYYYFPSKESIFFGYAEASDDFMIEKAAELKTDSAAELLKQLILLKTECIAEVGSETCNVGWIAELKHHRDVSLDIRRVAYGYFMNAIEKGMRTGEFRRDLNLYTVTSMLRYALGGLIIQWAIQSESINLMEEAERIADAFLEMLRPIE